MVVLPHLGEHFQDMVSLPYNRLMIACWFMVFVYTICITIPCRISTD